MSNDGHSEEIEFLCEEKEICEKKNAFFVALEHAIHLRNDTKISKSCVRKQKQAFLWMSHKFATQSRFICGNDP